MSRTRSLLATCAIALSIPALAAGCGGDDDEASQEDPQTVLEQTFNNEGTISSGDLDLTMSISAEGEQGGSFDLSLSGPFQGNPENPQAVPQLDWTGSVTGEGGGQSIDESGSLVITEDNAYVEYQGQAYEVGTQAFSQLRDQAEAQAQAQGEEPSFGAACRQALAQAGGDPAACDIDVTAWLTELTNEGTEEVAGTDTIHIHGDADVERILTDVGNLVASIPGASAQAGFDPAQLDQASEAVTAATFDVYSGADDKLLRKLDANIAIDPSALGSAAAVPVDSVEIALSFELSGVNEEQTIEAPADAQPIEELLGGLGLDGGSFDLDLGQGGGGAGAGAGGANADEYLDCIAKAQTPAEINACASS